MANRPAGRDHEPDDDRDHHPQRGHEAKHPAQVEEQQADVAVPPLLLDEQRRDQEAAEDEEEVDAEVPAGRPAKGVEEDDRDDRERAERVEAGLIAERRRAFTARRFAA